MAEKKLDKQGLVLPQLASVKTQPDADQYKGGQFKHIADGYVYELCKVDNCVFGKNYKLRIPAQKDDEGKVVHPGVFWEGNAEEFKAAFEKL